MIAVLGEAIDSKVLQEVIVSLSKRGFGSFEFQSSVAMAIEVMLSNNVELGSALVETMRNWLLAEGKVTESLVEGEQEEGEQEQEQGTSRKDNDPVGRSLLWGYGGFSIVPEDRSRSCTRWLATIL